MIRRKEEYKEMFAKLKIEDIADQSMKLQRIDEKTTPRDKVKALHRIHQFIVDSLQVASIDQSDEEINLINGYIIFNSCPKQLDSTIKFVIH